LLSRFGQTIPRIPAYVFYAWFVAYACDF
jgi:hypothetical protein